MMQNVQFVPQFGTKSPNCKTACPYCGVGCGVIASPDGKGGVKIKGDPEHPANLGRLCSKGSALGETTWLEDRLLSPWVQGAPADWDTALDLVAEKFKSTIAEHGPDSVAFYVSGQLLTEDYYVANKLMKGFIGSGNIDTNSRLCMSSAVAAHNRAFGEDVVPCSYTDLEEADLVILVGSNTAWCHPVIWQRIEAARKARGLKLVVIDPRRTETAQQADLHLPIAPDGDVALFNAALSAMKARGQIDRGFLLGHVDTPENFWAGLDEGAAADGTGLSPGQLGEFLDLVERHPRMVTLFSQGANQSVCGTDKGNAIINLHLATGRIGKPGTGPFSITGQPNAMGGREVGGLANMLAAHLDFSADQRKAVADFWEAPNLCRGPGLKAVDMFRAVDEGRIKAIWIMATNPAVSMPDAGFVRRALEKCDFVAVSDVIADTDTARLADVRLPALGWGEKDGTVTNSERVISRQRALFPPPGEARADWDIIADVARRMGYGKAFAYGTAAGIFREFAAMTDLSVRFGKKLDLRGWAGLTDPEYDRLTPFQWGGKSPYARGRGFSTPNGKARLVPVAAAPLQHLPGRSLALNTGRYRDQWHTMTRTGLSPKLSVHRPEPLVEVHRADARRHKLEDGGLARLVSAHGDSVYRVAVHDGQRQGELFVPMHWTDSQSAGGRTGRLVAPLTDPVSGQPAFKNVPVTVEPFLPDWRAFLVARDVPQTPMADYWTKSRISGGWLVELAGRGDADLSPLLPAGQVLEASDIRRGMVRYAVLGEDGHLDGALFVTRTGQLPPRQWIMSVLGGTEASPAELLAGRPATPMPDRGPIVCVCFDVGTKTILRAIADQSLQTVEQVGKALNAGTNCGSCRPALAQLLAVGTPEMEAAE